MQGCARRGQGRPIKVRPSKAVKKSKIMPRMVRRGLERQGDARANVWHTRRRKATQSQKGRRRSKAWHDNKRQPRTAKQSKAMQRPHKAHSEACKAKRDGKPRAATTERRRYERDSPAARHKHKTPTPTQASNRRKRTSTTMAGATTQRKQWPTIPIHTRANNGCIALAPFQCATAPGRRRTPTTRRKPEP